MKPLRYLTIGIYELNRCHKCHEWSKPDPTTDLQPWNSTRVHCTKWESIRLTATQPGRLISSEHKAWKSICINFMFNHVEIRRKFYAVSGHCVYSRDGSTTEKITVHIWHGLKTAFSVFYENNWESLCQEWWSFFIKTAPCTHILNPQI